MKDDIAQFRAVCVHCVLTADQRRHFSQWLHELKEGGEKGSKPNGDFTWEELVTLCEEFKQESES